MASLFKASGGSVAIIPTTSWSAPANLFPTTDRNDGSIYTFVAATSTVTLPSSGLADGYLILARYELEDTSNGRSTPQGQFVRTTGTGTFVSGAAGGYTRDNSEDRAYVHAWAFIDNPSAASMLQFQWKRDTDAPTGGTVRSAFEVIPLYYSDAGIYSSTDSSLYGGTTPNQVTGFTGTDGTNITMTSNVVSMTGDNKRYLCLGSQFFEGRGGRTQRWHGFRIDGTKDDASKAYSYYRNASNDESGDMFTTLIETSTATVTLDQFCYRGDGVANGQGGADSDGSTPSVGNHAIVVLELNDSAEVFKSHLNTNTGDLTTATTAIDVNEVTDFNDTASFTDLVDGSINCVSTADYLFGANISAASNNVANTQRWTAYAELTVNGTVDPDLFAGDYMRNNQGTIDTFGWSGNFVGFQALSAGDDVGVSVTPLTGSEDGGDGISPAGWSGLWGLNIDTLESAGAVTHGTSGDLAGQGSSVDGSAAREDGAVEHSNTGTLEGSGSSVSSSSSNMTEHATSGVLDGQGSSLDGSASNFSVKTSTGTLEGQGSSVDGASERATAPHETNGALEGSGSNVDGSADRITVRTSNGALSGQGSNVSGDASSATDRASTGALTGSGSNVNGTSAREDGPMARTRISSILTLGLYGPLVNDLMPLGYVSGATITHANTGALEGQGSVVTGSATNFAVRTSSGALEGQGSDVAGTASSATDRTSSGILQGQGANVDGDAARERLHPANGVLQGGESEVNGTSQRSNGPVAHASTGILSGQDSSVNGSSQRGDAPHESSGTLSGQGSQVDGASFRTRIHATTSVLVGQGSVIAGVASSATERTSSGALVGSGSAIDGASERSAAGHDSSGALIGQGSVITGASVKNTVYLTTGILQGQEATITGVSQLSTGPITHVTIGVLSGVGARIVGIADVPPPIKPTLSQPSVSKNGTQSKRLTASKAKRSVSRSKSSGSASGSRNTKRIGGSR